MTNTHAEESAATTRTTATRREPAPGAGGDHRGSRRWLLVAGVAIVALVALATWMLLRDDAGATWQVADMGEQGGQEDPVMASDAARLQRRPDGLFVEVRMPTPPPGTYDYPTRDMLPPWVEFEHPPVSPGAGDAPEVFTAWFIVFNNPDACTDGACDADDFAPDAAARGGVHQLDGRVADETTLTFAGNLRVGEEALDGVPLDDPMGAEAHVLIAPHGRALSGTGLAIQLNTPLGNPTLWWLARFPAPSG